MQESIAAVPVNRRRFRLTYGKVFLMGVLLYLICVLPLLVRHGGLFFYYGDYNVQQVPFYVLAHRAVRSGNFFWNSKIDLGGSMGGSLSFYLWGSPFFWLTIPFPEKVVPYLLPFLMSLKCGTAMTTSYAWIRTQTKSDEGALIGALLYSFSGFQAMNIVFQHFHDATAFFPLFLLCFDRRVQKREHTPFILMTALMSVINYYFFFGQVLFIILYYVLRYAWRQKLTVTVREVVLILLDGILGLCLSAFFLVQSISGLTGNSRLSNLISGYDMVAYPDPTTPLAILKSMFLVPDLIAKGTLFSNDNIRNGSLSAYLPCFALTGVIAFVLRHKKSWKRRMMLACLVTAFIPVLNSLFSALNSDYYARWFYMPLLVMAAMTGASLEEGRTKTLQKGAIITMVMTALIILCNFLPQTENGKTTWGSITENTDLFRTQVIGTLVTIPVLIFVVFVMRGKGERRGRRRTAAAVPAGETGAGGEAPVSAQMQSDAVPAAAAGQSDAVPAAAAEGGAGEETVPVRPAAPRRRGSLATWLVAVLTAACCVVSTSAVLHNGDSLIALTGGMKWRVEMLETKPKLRDSEGFFRVETDGTSTNYEMVWGYPTIHCFESTVTPTIFTFYRGIGMIRTVESTLPFDRAGSRAILSQRYYIENSWVTPSKTYDEQGGILGYALERKGRYYNIYRNQHAIPMGFTFDSYMTEADFDSMAKGVTTDRLLVKNLILSQKDADKYGHLMSRDTVTTPVQMGDQEFFDYCDARAKSACSSFAFDNSGFRAKASLPAENLVFFSVPCDRGWSAYVDGEKKDIVVADYGLMAVDVPAGEHSIVFRYVPYGLYPAIGLSCAAAALVIGLALWRRKRR